MSDTPKHSPGPFTHKVSTKRFGKTVITVNTICDAHDHILISESFSSSWDCEDGQGTDLATCDWHLFAAAPEMLEALKRILPSAIAYEMDNSDQFDEDGRIAFAEAAIAKAEGRTP
jgi:hypothetical protein